MSENEDRDVRGRFAQGNRGGPGGPRRRASELRRAAEDAISPEHIQAMIRKLIDAEQKAKPLSDQALMESLKQAGIQVARRTVAKYREAMNIPSSSDRLRKA